jgi:hypothetical protein
MYILVITHFLTIMAENLIKHCVGCVGCGGCTGCTGCAGCDANLCNVLYACTPSDITKAMIRLPLLAKLFNNAVSAIKASIARGTKEDRVVIAEFAAKVYAELTLIQRQRLDEPLQWSANDSVVMNFMFVIITEMNKWKEE